MQYTRLAIVVVILIALVFWLRQCSAPDESSDMQATLDNLKNHAASQTQGQPGGPVPTAPAQTPKPATGS